MPANYDTFPITSSTGGYDVHVGHELISALAVRHKDVIVIADAFFENSLPFDPDRIISVVATEDNKSLEEMAPLIKRMRNLGVNRGTHLIAVGGGIIQDISTFLSSIYMRGIRWTYAPTTLLAKVDSCIGGKSSINVAGLKNLVGNFYPPTEVVADMDFVRTLKTPQIVDGLCEAAKICYAKNDFDGYLSDVPTVAADPHMARRVVRRSLQAKRWFIEIDEFDQKERLLLNLGHTFGHAVESVSDFAISHGVGVGIGILVAEAYALQHNMLSEDGRRRAGALSSYMDGLLRQIRDLPDKVAALDPTQVVAKFDGDKKHRTDQYRIVVPVGDGGLELMVVPRTDEGRAAISAAFSAGFLRITRGMTV